MLNHDSLAIAAIFRDEFDYLLEWFAWHQIAGFKKFFIADNGSTDGTVALLEALGDLGIVDLIYQPVLLKRSQNTAYPKQAVVEIAENDTGCLKKREFIKVGVEHLFLNKKKIYCPIPKSKICHTILEQANYSDNFISEEVGEFALTVATKHNNVKSAGVITADDFG